jgi:hypothetical protein
VATLRGAGLADDVAEAVGARNAEELFGLKTPVPAALPSGV